MSAPSLSTGHLITPSVFLPAVIGNIGLWMAAAISLCFSCNHHISFAHCYEYPTKFQVPPMSQNGLSISIRRKGRPIHIDQLKMSLPLAVRQSSRLPYSYVKTALPIS